MVALIKRYKKNWESLFCLIIGAGEVILDSEGRVLLVKHSTAKTIGICQVQKLKTNCKREVHEEVGLEVGMVQLTGTYYDPNFDIYHFVFIANYDNNQVPQPSSPEIVECRFCSRDDRPKPISYFTCKRIEDALSQHRQNLFHVVRARQWIE